MVMNQLKYQNAMLPYFNRELTILQILYKMYIDLYCS